MLDRRNREVERAAWINIIHACHNPEHKAYKYYGAEGVIVAAEFRDESSGYAAFLAEIGPKPSREYVITRKDTALGFIPNNIEWRLREPGFVGRIVDIEGVKKTLREWSQSSGVAIDTIRSRYAAGKRGRDLIAAPHALPRRDKGKPRK